MRYILIVLLLLLFFGCEMLIEEYSYSTDQIPTMGFQTVRETIEWIHENIIYTSDGAKDEWSLPHETYLKRAGDCEDVAILAMYFIKTELKRESFFEGGYYYDNNIRYGHAWVSVNDIPWEPQQGTINLLLPSICSKDRVTYDYDETMYCARNK